MVVSVGIDVGKTSCSVAVLHQDAHYTESSFPNTLAGIETCISFLKHTGVFFETPVILESTGAYHLLFAMTLKDAHFRGVKVINAILTKKYHKAKIRKIKTDRVDARLLADMGSLESFLSFTQTRKQLQQKQLITLLKQLQSVHQQLKASLKAAQELAKNLQLHSSTTGVEKIVASIQTEILQLEQKIVDAVKNPLVDSLSQIKGVSLQAAAIIVSLLAGKSFHSKDQLVAFTGLDLSIRESGTSIHAKRHLSKRGDPFLRKKLFQTAWALKTHDPRYRLYYLKKRQEGNHYYTCLIAVARKFLHHLLALHKKLSLNQTFSISSP